MEAVHGPIVLLKPAREDEAMTTGDRPMILRQMFDAASCSYSYLLASRNGGEAVLIDPVLEHVDRYLRLLAELDLRLVHAIDTHLHADRYSGVAALRARTNCLTAMSEHTSAEVATLRLADGEAIDLDGLRLRALHTPGHTADSMCFTVDGMVFTGDTLLIRGTGRTDLPGGDAAAAYDSIFGRLLRLPEATLVYPAHDYSGQTVSTIGEERRHSRRLQARSRAEYVVLMEGLRLPPPKLMQAALAANLRGSPEAAVRIERAAPSAVAPASIELAAGWLARTASLGTAVAAAIRDAPARWRSARQRARTIEALRGLDPRTLHDVGIDRSEIGSIAMELHGAAERTRRRTLTRMPWN
jgi:glyoxylase-like metal-dependent hydrolase (beta-lactamase superfamily II)/uncharacterized protein YjiS (DUF1127 family)